jgi:hypothetical protein
MILHYLWVKRYKGINDREFNFGCKYNFLLDRKTGILTVRDLDSLPQGFFEPKSTQNASKIVNVTCIVGENGVGKSSILRFLREELGGYPGPSEGLYTEVLWIYENPTEPGQILHFQGSRYLINSIIGSKKVSDDFESGRFNPKMDFPKNSKANLAVIYYSNVVDFVSEFESNLLANISTNWMLSTDLKMFSIIDGSEQSIMQYAAYRSAEIKRNIRFLASKQHSDKIPFMFSRTLKIGVVDPVLERHRKHFGEPIPEEPWSQIKSIVRNPRTVNVPNTRIRVQHFLDKLHASALSNILFEMGFPDGVPEIDNKSFLAESTQPRVLNYLDGLISFSQPTTSFYSQVLALKNFLQSAQKVAEEIPQSIWDQSDGQMTLNLEGTIPSNLEKMVDLYYQAVEKRDFIHFSWENLSTGQQAMLSFFSRFYDVLYSRPEVIKENMLVLIDEGTEGFHPEWQRRFLKYVLDFVPFLYESVKRMQIIFTTNSPIAISDIPRDNLIVMTKHTEGDEKTELLDVPQTFGANIHTFYSKKFFMESSVGAFAEEKINNVITFLNGELDTGLNFETAQVYISLIGEPILRNLLQRMLDAIGDRDRNFDQQD